jgi:hypothetical protein
MPKSRKRWSIHPLPHMPSWRSALLVKHRDIFTLHWQISYRIFLILTPVATIGVIARNLLHKRLLRPDDLVTIRPFFIHSITQFLINIRGLKKSRGTQLLHHSCTALKSRETQKFGAGNKTHCAHEGQQQFTRPTYRLLRLGPGGSDWYCSEINLTVVVL